MVWYVTTHAFFGTKCKLDDLPFNSFHRGSIYSPYFMELRNFRPHHIIIIIIMPCTPRTCYEEKHFLQARKTKKKSLKKSMVGVDVFPMEKVSFLGDMFVSLHYAIPPPVSAIFGNSHGFQLPKGCFYGLNRWEETSGNFRIFTNEQKIYLKFKNCWFLWEKNTSNSRLVVDKKEENSPGIHCFVFLKTPSTGGKPKKNPHNNRCSAPRKNDQGGWCPKWECLGLMRGLYIYTYIFHLSLYIYISR